MTQSYDFLADAGHGWLVVTPEQAEAIGLKSADLTDSSYIRNGIFYAEEDCDLATVFMLHHKRYGEIPKIGREVDGSPRAFRRCSGSAPKYHEAFVYLDDVKRAA